MTGFITIRNCVLASTAAIRRVRFPSRMQPKPSPTTLAPPLGAVASRSTSLILQQNPK